MGDSKVTLFSAQTLSSAGMIHQEVNHRDIGEKCEHRISNHDLTYKKDALQVRHLRTGKALSPLQHHFCVTNLSRRADRSRSICQAVVAFRQHIHKRINP